jgi:Ca2+-binding EF-hand superfamily protein
MPIRCVVVHGLKKTSGTSCIICRSLIQKMSKLSAESMSVYKSEFDKYDTNKDGSIDVKELGQMVRGLGPLSVLFRLADADESGDISDAEVAALFRSADTDSDGTITFDEFLVLRQGGLVKAEFDKFDVNKDGSIDAKELGQMLRSLGPKSNLFRAADTDGSGDISDAEVLALFKKADTDGNGVITFDEFVLLSSQSK